MSWIVKQLRQHARYNIKKKELLKVYIGLKPELPIVALQDNLQYFCLKLKVQKPRLKIKGHFSGCKPKLTVATFFI
jgi:hypothetical protein